MLQRLLERRADAEARYSRADASVAGAIIDGDSDRVRELRRERRDAAEEADDLGEALRLAEDREAERRRAQEADRLRSARAEARSAASTFVSAGRSVDAALETLDGAVARMEEAGHSLSVRLSAAGHSDNGRIVRGLHPALRWALWYGAPAAARMCDVPRSLATCRRPMAEAAGRLVPHISEED